MKKCFSQQNTFITKVFLVKMNVKELITLLFFSKTNLNSRLYWSNDPSIFVLLYQEIFCPFSKSQIWYGALPASWCRENPKSFISDTNFSERTREFRRGISKRLITPKPKFKEKHKKRNKKRTLFLIATHTHALAHAHTHARERFLNNLLKPNSYKCAN